MSLTAASRSTLATVAVSGSTNSNNAQPTTQQPVVGPNFFGWLSVGEQSGTPVYSAGSCSATQSFSASGTFAKCCDDAAPCTFFTGCSAQSFVVGAGITSQCAFPETCKTDTVYQTAVDATPTLAFYCGNGIPEYDWFRDLPTPGITEAPSSPSVTNTPTGSTHWGAIGGGVGGLLVLAVICGACICVCRGLCGFGGRRRYNGSSFGGYGGAASQRRDAEAERRRRWQQEAEERRRDMQNMDESQRRYWEEEERRRQMEEEMRQRQWDEDDRRQRENEDRQRREDDYRRQQEDDYRRQQQQQQDDYNRQQQQQQDDYNRQMQQQQNNY